MSDRPTNPDDELALHVGARIRKLREAQGLSLQDVVDRGGVANKAHLSHIERGHIQVTVATLARLARSLGTTARDLVPTWPLDRAEISRRVARLPDAKLARVAELVELLEQRPEPED